MRREQSRREEIANAVSHGVGFTAAVTATPLLISHAVAFGGGVQILAASVFAASVLFLYLTSSLYHALASGRAKSAFRVAEHSGIYLLIAGTYTPFTLGVLHGAWGWALFGVVWCLAGTGILLTVVAGIRHPRVSTSVYVGMGWLIVAAAQPVLRLVPPRGIAWLVLGGLAYTVGVAFYAAPRLRYGHFVWHLFVLLGTTCHFLAVMWYAA